VVAVPQNILTQSVNVAHDRRLAQAVLGALDMAPDERVPWASGNTDPTGGSGPRESRAFETYVALQYWPESLTDSRGAEWNPRNIPGGSHPIYQWTHGGERRLSFTAIFTTDTDVPDEQASRDDPYETLAANPLSGIQKGKRDLDIRAVLSWLRYFTYPLYGTGESLQVFEPPKVILMMPNTALGHDGSDYVIGVMTTCDITYQSWFPNGMPRITEVSLEFCEVVQSGGRVNFHSRNNMGRSRALGSYLRARDTRPTNAR